MINDSDDSLKLENQLCFPLYVAARQITNKYTPILKPLGLTYTQYIMFMVLWEKDDITVGEIGERLHLDNGTLTPLLKKMENCGFVIRERSKEDERVVRIKLTKEGRDLKKKVASVPTQVCNCIKLTEEEKKILYKVLYKLIED